MKKQIVVEIINPEALPKIKKTFTELAYKKYVEKTTKKEG